MSDNIIHISHKMRKIFLALFSVLFAYGWLLGLCGSFFSLLLALSGGFYASFDGIKGGVSRRGEIAGYATKLWNTFSFIAFSLIISLRFLGSYSSMAVAGPGRLLGWLVGISTVCMRCCIFSQLSLFFALSLTWHGCGGYAALQHSRCSVGSPLSELLETRERVNAIAHTVRDANISV